MNRFSKLASNLLKSYVYVLTDPFTNGVFYVGKGTGPNRPFTHLHAKNMKSGDPTAEKIKEIRARGRDPVVEIVRYGLDARSAFLVESALIDTLGLNNLTNDIRGHGSIQRGRIPADVLNRQLDGKPINWEDIEVSGILFYAHQAQTQALDLYDGVRGNWPLNKKKIMERDDSGRLKYRYAFAMRHSEILEIYEILDWYPACTTVSSRSPKSYRRPRWEFIGKYVEEKEIRRYKNRILHKAGKPLSAAQVGFRYLRC